MPEAGGSAVCVSPLAGVVTVLSGSGAGGSVAVPLTETPVGFPGASWAKQRDAVLLPADAGEKVTLTSWLPPALTVKDVGETEKAAASAPDIEMPETLSAALPVLETASVWLPEAPAATSPKVNEAATEMTGTGISPLPFTDTSVAGALLVIVSFAFLAAEEVGV